jgi:microcystin-dependent protein
MSVKLSDFATGQTVRDTDHVVGYADTNTGGERKWTLANLRNSLITGAATTIDTENLTASRALISNASGKVDVSNVTSTEIGYLDGVTSGIQAQLNSKGPGTVTSVTGTAPISVATGTTTPAISISEATQSAAGIMSAADKTKLDGISGIPSGAIMAFAMNTAPSGWRECNGASISTGGINAALFAAISYTYGGSGGSFNLPDLRGYFVRGVDNTRGIDPSRVFGSNQDDAFKAHTHTIGVRSNPAREAGGGETIISGGTTTTNSTGGTETRPKNIAMLYCIKL